MSRLDVHFGFDHQFLRARSGVRVKLRAQKVGLPERSMSTPVNKVTKRETICSSSWSSFVVKQVISIRYLKNKDKRAVKAVCQRKACPYILSRRYNIRMVDSIVTEVTD